MSATTCATPASFVSIALPKVRNSSAPSRFGDVILVAFLLVQCCDGVFTYVGVSAFGLGIEANPIIAGLMANLGHGVGLLSAKVMAAFLGICLHFRQVHLAVAMLTGFYAAAAVGPWVFILFF